MMTGPLFSCTAAAFASLLLAAAPATKPAPAPAASPAAKAAAPAKDADKWATKVQKAYEGVKDLSADFEQVSLLGAAGLGPKQTGTIELKKPGKMRWEFATPEKKSLVSDGKTLWMYDGEENQVIVNEFMQETTSVTALNFLEGLGDLKKSFTVALATMPPEATAKDALFLTLTPKDTADVQFTSILIGIDQKTGLAQEVFLTNPMGQQTRLTLSKLEKNKSLPDSRFVFEIPKGAEVIKPQLLQ